MVFSGLFQERFISQIQVVGYLHEWELNEKGKEDVGGDFVYYLSNDEKTGMKSVSSKSGLGTIVDGSKVVHAAKIYQPSVKAPYLDKDKDCHLIYQGNEKWQIFCDHQPLPENQGVYDTSELRISIVYRARCFRSEREKQRYHSQTPEDMIPLETIMNTFKEDLVKNKGYKKDYINSLKPFNFAMLLVDKYLKYPLPPRSATTIPFNYCALPVLVPWTDSLMEFLGC
jgi:hypothetical protein